MTDEWLSLSDAAKILGVHPGTVRLWSDKGLLPTHKTQGGHRRYRRSEISLWAESNHRSNAIEPEGMMNEVVKNVRLQISEGRLQAESWYQKLDDDARTQYRMSARSLFHGLMNYVATHGAEAESESYAIGYEYASRAHRYSLNYVDAAKAFLFFRNTLIESVIKVYGEANVPSGQTAEMFQKMHVFTDEILISLLQTYQSLNASR
ncbi:MAG TPA: helix-turn-helix domain-containing protein [Anaerolineales bacterium]|nr:helix-turn-helix domain-containing protein [Anaerolineales bacterium]HMV96377.1 helix-turn-helix domain-containing protein [Anaerolineales bacterium]HMX20392.1 helix-turn-helix domain-containing protein [Anaerolineales bacterium]HNA54975.1 helix-turn-helix domain-containing protein [Anaerolineales bacterium]HNB87214.1 helix-turn-helix domain-containing protein [Anaerolineales bacterium]